MHLCLFGAMQYLQDVVATIGHTGAPDSRGYNRPASIGLRPDLDSDVIHWMIHSIILMVLYYLGIDAINFLGKPSWTLSKHCYYSFCNA